MSKGFKKCLCIKDYYGGYQIDVKYKFELVSLGQNAPSDVYQVFQDDDDPKSAYSYFDKAEFTRCFIDISLQEEREEKIQTVLT